MNNTSRSNNRSFSTRFYQSNFRESVPCQYCNDNELFDMEQLSDHLKTYHQDNHQPIFQRCIQRQLITSAVPCEYCEVRCPFDDINLHQMDCHRNPRNILNHRIKTIKSDLSSKT
ncbi:unnamed protein product [Rotaria magnacalcarata]|nr:unnamed protein product [Rotaria magnacalcarata]CAF4638307.1 unnamed protein product [Rotaria magnacalcarata]